MFRISSIKLLPIIATALLLAACASRYSAPVADIDSAPRFVDAGRTHRVNDGESLYVVAWMYDLDVNALARANNLREPYTIRPGQLLTIDLRGLQGSTTTAARPAPVGTATVTPAAVAGGIQRAPLDTAPLTRQPLPSTSLPESTPRADTATPPPVARTETAPVPRTESQPLTPPPATPRDTGTVAVTPPPAARDTTPAPVTPAPAPTETPVAPAAVATTTNGPIVWAWPARGNIIGRYSDSDPDSKGIKLGGSEGDPVLAAADGEVVYTGNGLLRYGELVILKHDERFLSAYAHNKAINVKEGDRVTRGQKIAELGSTGIDRDMLHFEIRLDGKPVDPMRYLPAR